MDLSKGANQRRMKHLDEENARLKRMYADLSLTHEATKDFIKKKVGDAAAARSGE